METFFADFLNVIYDYNLKNLNFTNANTDSIDLGDSENRICYQITSNRRKNKIQKTIDGFIENELQREYDTLKVLIVGPKQESYKNLKTYNLNFTEKVNICNLQDILRDIQKLRIRKLAQLCEIIDEETANNINQTGRLIGKDWKATTRRLLDLPKSGRNWRNSLLLNLHSFAVQGSGVIIGAPGVGKSHTLQAFCSQLLEDNCPCLYLPIDKLGVNTDDSLVSELRINEEIITYLGSIISASGASKGFLVIDAFDAARSETTRSYFLGLIRRVLREHRSTWNVIVSVRTYDATKSEELQGLFPTVRHSQPPSQYQREGIYCRHFFIPPLSDEERQEAVQSIPPLIPIFKKGNEDFLNLLRIPFNIWLLEKILDRNPDLPELSSVGSEVQLLGLFWKQRVTEGSNSADKRQLLTRATRAMVQNRSLSVREEQVYILGTSEAWDSLLSSEVLAHTSSTAQRVAFFHNILFDYAVSVLLMEDEPSKLIEFLNEDQSRPFFLRPSLNYYFTRLWLTTPQLFWEAFWRFLPHKDLHLRLIAQLVPTTVIAKEARSIDQLYPLIGALAESKPFSQDAILRLLRALDATGIRCDELWILFLDEVSKHPHSSFLGLMSWMTSDILKRNIESQVNDKTIRKCGTVARKLLAWFWDCRKEKVDAFLDSVGAKSLVPIVAQTYGTETELSRAVLEPVLSLTSENNYPIDYLYMLSHEIDKIWVHDPDFAARTYDTVFGSYETSVDPTQMGTPVLPLRSTRRQDYEMCRYILIEYYPRFLLFAPQTAATMAISILNRSILGDHALAYLKAGVELKDLAEEFSFRGRQAHYIPDLSYIWGDNQYEDYLKMGNALFQYIAELSSTTEIETLLDIFSSEVWVAYFWRGPLDVCARNPSTFAKYLFELCIARPIQTGSETIWQLGRFLEATIEEFTEEQRLEIEQSILSIPEENENQRDRLEHIRNRLLGRIPPALLRTDEGIALRAEMDKNNSVPRNEPISTFEFSSEPYSEDDWLREQGADLEKLENKALRLLCAPLNEFDSQWQNKTPSPEAIQEILPLAKDLYAALQSEPSADCVVLDSAWTALAASAEAMSRGIKNADTEEFRFCREALIQSSQHPLPEPDPEDEARFNSPSWSPSPRTEAARGLPWLSIHAIDEKLLGAIEALTKDKRPEVRFLVTGELFRLMARAPEGFWRIANNLADNETNRVVLYALCSSLGRLIRNYEEPAVEILKKLDPYSKGKYRANDFMNYFVSLVMWLALDRQNDWAIREAKNYLANPREFALPLQHAALDALSFIKPGIIENPDKGVIADRAIDWLLDVLPPTGDSMKSLLEDLEREPSEEKREILRSIYGVFDEIVTRLCFSADVIQELRREGNTTLKDQQRCNYYNRIKPLLEGVLSQTADEKTSFLFAHTAHRFIQLLNGVIGCDPKGVIHMAAVVAKASELDNFNLDPMAAEEVVRLVEAVLADHREAVTEGEALEDLLSLLDSFAKAGWPAALRLVWRLDEIFR